MKREVENSLRTFLVELVVYAALVIGYYFLVLHLLGHWLSELFVHHRTGYALVALVFIVGQGLLLELLTRILLAWIKPRAEH